MLTFQAAMPRDADFEQNLCAAIDGLSLHAAVRCGADDRQALEQLCRYITRPALANESVQTMQHCPNCGGELKIIAAILEQPVIEKILTNLGLQASRPNDQGFKHRPREDLAHLAQHASRHVWRFCPRTPGSQAGQLHGNALARWHTFAMGAGPDKSAIASAINFWEFGRTE